MSRNDKTVELQQLQKIKHMRYFIFTLICTLPFQVFSQGSKDCIRIMENANTAIKDTNYSLALTKLRAYKVCNPEDAAAADEKIVHVFRLIEAQRDAAVEAKEEATRQKEIAISLGKRERKAKEETKRQYRIAQNLLGDQYLAKARIALSNNDFNNTIINIDSSLRIKKSREAELLISQVLNKIPPSLLDKMDAISDFSISPANEGIVAYIGFSDNSREQSTLKLLNRKTKTVAEVEGKFMTLAFSPDGKFLYAATQLRYELIKGADLEAEYEYEAGVIKFSNSLQPIDTILIKNIAVKNKYNFSGERDSLTYDARNYSRIDFTSDGKYMILSGSASVSSMRTINNAMPHHLRTWIELGSGKIMHDLGDEELSSFNRYRAITLLLDNERIVRDGYEEVYIIDLKKNTREKIGRHWSSINDMAISPDRKQIACVGSDNRITVLTQEGNNWVTSSYTVSAQSYCEQVIFINNNEVAVTRSDNHITLLALKSDSGRNNIVIDGNTQWRNFSARDFIGHSGKINHLSVSTDKKWLVSSSEDNSTRLWSLHESSSIALWGSKRGVVKSQIDKSGDLIAASIDGTLLAYNLSQSLRFNISHNVWNPKSEKAIPDVTWDEGGGLTRASIRRTLGLCRDIIFDKRKSLLYSIDYADSATVWSWKRELKPIDRIARSHPDSLSDLYFLDMEKNRFAEVVGSSKLVFHNFSGTIDSSRTAFGKFSASGKYFVWFNSSSQQLNIWRTDQANSLFQSYLLVGTSRPDMKELKFSDNEESFAFPCSHGGPAIGIVSLKMAKSFLYANDITGYSFDISPDGRSIVAAGRTGEVFYYSFFDNSDRILGRHSRFVSSVAFSRDGEYIASGSRDRSVRIWPISNSVGDYSYLPFTNPVEKVLFSPGGEQLLAVAGNGIHSFYFPSKEIVKLFSSSDHIERMSSTLLKYKQPVGKLYDSPLGIFPPHKAENRVNYVSKVLGKNPDLSASRMKDLQGIICSKKASYAQKFKAIFELSAFGSRALTCLAPIFEAFPSEVNFRANEMHRAILTELLPYTGPGTSKELIRSFQRINNKWSKVTIIQSLAHPELASKEVNTFLVSNFSSEDSDIRIVSAVCLPPSAANIKAIEIMAGALYVAHDLREDCSKKMQLYGKDAVPYLIHCLRSKTRSHYGNPVELAKKSLIAMSFNPSKIIIDSLESKQSDLELNANLVNVLDERGIRFPETLSLYLSIIEKEKANNKINQSLRSIIYAIGKYGASAKEAIPMLIDLLKNPKNNEIYNSLSTALGNIGPGSAPAIIKALPDARQEPKRHFYKALKSYPDSSKAVLPYLIEDLKHCSIFDCSELLELLLKFGKDAAAALPALFERLNKGEEYGISDVVMAIGLINHKHKESAEAIIQVMEKLINSADLEVYKASEPVIEQLAAKGVPVEVLMYVKDLDDMYRIRDNFQNILYNRLGEDNMKKYGKLILNSCLSTSPHYCDKVYAFSNCCEALRKLSVCPEGIENKLNAIMTKVSNCFNLTNELQSTIDYVKATRITGKK
jgi:WD40 repeat protein